MKLTKIFSVVTCSALALAGAFMFTGCPDNLGSGDISVTEGGAKASVNNVTNESSTDYRRTLEQGTILTKSGITSTITFENQTSSSEDGNMGIAFDYHSKKDDDGDTVYDFGIVALKAVNGKMVAYISYYSNVGGDYLSGSSTNFCDKNGVKIGDTYASDSDKTYNGTSLAGQSSLAKEYKVLPPNSSTNSWSDLDAKYYTSDLEDAGTVVSAVNIAVQEDGSFVVKIAKNTDSLDASKTENTDYVSYTVAQKVDNYYKTSNTDGSNVKFAYYANIRPTKTLKGNWATSWD